MPSRAATLILALAVFTAVGVIFLGPVAEVTAGSTGQQTVTNETVIANYNNSADLRGYDLDPGSETVYAPDGGSYIVVAESGNYTLADAPGELSFNSSSTVIQEGEEVKVSYTYQASGALTALVVGFVPLALGLLIFVKLSDGVTGYLPG